MYTVCMYLSMFIQLLAQCVILQHVYTFVVDRLILIRKRSDSAQDVEDVEASEILNSMEDMEETEDMEDTETGLRT